MQPTNFFNQLAQQPDYTHLTPVSTYVFSGFRYIAIQLHQNASPTQWHGSALRGISKAVAVAGYCLNMPIALAETAVGLSAATIGIGLHLLTGARSETLQRYTLKSIAYTFNSLGNLLLQLIFLGKLRFPEYHTHTAILNQANYLLCGLSTQLVGGYIFDQMAGRNPVNRGLNGEENPLPPSLLRTGYLLAQQIPSTLREIITGIDRDFNHHRQYLVESSVLQSFLNAHPEYGELIRSFTFSRLAEADYRQQISRMVTDFFTHQQMLRPADPVATANTEFVISTNQASDDEYRNQLQTFVKNGVKEIYQTPELVSCLGENEQAGKEALEGFYPEVYLPIAHYAQLKELESDLTCPNTFGSNDLRSYNERRQKLEEAQRELRALSSEEKDYLIKKLLNSDYTSEQSFSEESKARIQHLYNAIGSLGGSLHQGKLMSQLTVNIGTGNQLFSSQNLFQKAYQDALQEV
ncbi:hypothetical protein [Candidatus Protochlamydia phocaeensis]|uniref:hypothetical protein n=1 Tax=Candidatus Protochlamydia phocaeensis TaxID=1414722 RepID=UPI00083844D5|nr:hypothetical protein [Candidatus Protochlamydia phocaeensis]